jgi:hypothetical protein
MEIKNHREVSLIKLDIELWVKDVKELDFKIWIKLPYYDLQYLTSCQYSTTGIEQTQHRRLKRNSVQSRD